jgi:hypothetical protein
MSARRSRSIRNTLGQLCAGRLDTPPQIIRAVAVAPMIGDELGD